MIVNCYFVYCADMRTASVLGWKTWWWNRIFLAAATNVIVTQYYSLFSTVSLFLHPYCCVYSVCCDWQYYIIYMLWCSSAASIQICIFFDFASQNGDLWCILGAIFCSSVKTLRGRKDTLAQVYFFIGGGGNRPPLAPGIDVTGVADA